MAINNYLGYINNMTAVEWLWKRLPSLFEHDDNGFYKKMFEEAKEIEMERTKEKVMKAFYDGMQCFPFDPNMGRAELYYKEQYEQTNEL